MPSNHLLKDLPFVDEDGYFEGVCSVQMGGGISLPANVAEAAVPEDTEHFFYKLNATRDGFDAEKKPTTAAECVACGVISHESQTAHCSELRELFQKLTEGSSEYHVVRGDNLSWRVEKIPEKTFEDAKAEKTAQLDSSLSHSLAHKKTKSADRHTCAGTRKINKRFVQSDCPQNYACDNKARKYSCGSEFCFVNENLTCHADQSANPECI